MNLYTSLIFILTSAVLCVRINSKEKSWFKLNITIFNRASGDSRYDWATKRRTKPDLTWTFCVLSLQDNCVCLIRRLFYLPDCFVRWLRASSSLGEERSSFCFYSVIGLKWLQGFRRSLQQYFENWIWEFEEDLRCFQICIKRCINESMFCFLCASNWNRLWSQFYSWHTGFDVLE